MRSEEVLSRETRNAALECIIQAVDRYKYDLADSMVRCGLVDTGKLLDQTIALDVFKRLFFSEIHWNDRISIRPIIPIIEEAFMSSYWNFTSIHKHLLEMAAWDGFAFKNGRLVEMSSNTIDQNFDAQRCQHNSRLNDAKSHTPE